METAVKALTKRQIEKSKFFSKYPSKSLEIALCTEVSLLCWKFNKKAVATKNPRVADLELENIKSRAIELGAILENEMLSAPKTYNPSVFSKNPMRGASINECEDDGLLCWKFNKSAIDVEMPDEIKDQELLNIKRRALDLGATFYDGKLYSKAAQEKYFIKEINKANELASGKTISFEAKSNLKYDGEEAFIETKFARIIFPNFKQYEATYYAPSYTLPIDENGKAKHIKNHTITINEYEKIENRNGKSAYVVLNWQITK